MHIPTPVTIADGAQTQHLGQVTFPVIRDLVAGIRTASDAELVAAMQFFATRMKVVVEPTGCLGLAGLRGLAGAGDWSPGDVRGLRIGVLISGGNVDLERFAALVGGRADAAS